MHKSEQNMKYKIAIAGTGYVGLVAGVCFAEKGQNVVCVDVDETKVEKMKKGISPIYEQDLEPMMQKNYKEGRLDFTTDYKKAYKDADFIFIGVGTPERADGSANLDYVYEVAKQIAETIEKDCIIVVKSTVPIGTNDDVEKYIRDNLVHDVEISVASNPEFLAQGTIYPDILESDGVKAHHNVGGLPENLKFELVEPVKLLFKDEVRVIGKTLGLPDNMVYRQPFPGPGLGVRCLGAITRDRLEAVRESDAILREEFAKNGLEGKVWQYFTIIPDFKSTGITEGKRTYEWPVIIRAINTLDAMNASVAKIDFELLQQITNRITNEVKGVNRVVFDLTPKPSGTIEWE